MSMLNYTEIVENAALCTAQTNCSSDLKNFTEGQNNFGNKITFIILKKEYKIKSCKSRHVFFHLTEISSIKVSNF